MQSVLVFYAELSAGWAFTAAMWFLNHIEKLFFVFPCRNLFQKPKKELASWRCWLFSFTSNNKNICAFREIIFRQYFAAHLLRCLVNKLRLDKYHPICLWIFLYLADFFSLSINISKWIKNKIARELFR